MPILNKYKRWKPQLIIDTENQWDFVLSQDNTPTIPLNGNLTTHCLAAYIDAGRNECIDDKGLVSVPDYNWESAVNGGETLKDIGFTGIDNGLIKYEKDRISNAEFYDILTNSTLPLSKDDLRLHLNKVDGNSKLYSYPMEYVEDGKDSYYSLNGGFFQGFYKLYGFDYQLLPQYIEDAWTVEITLRPHYNVENDDTLNMTHENTKGIFFYMGTRAENKFAQIYNCDFSGYNKRKEQAHELCERFTEDGYFAVDESQIENDACCCDCDSTTSIVSKSAEEQTMDFNMAKMSLFAAYLWEQPNYERNACGCSEIFNSECKACKCNSKVDCSKYFSDNYIVGNCELDIKDYKLPDYYKDDYKVTPLCDNGSFLATDDEYFVYDVDLKTLEVTTSEGFNVTENGYFEISTDNKFLIFNRTKLGFTANNWDDDDLLLITGHTREYKDNPFLIFNRTPNGMTAGSLSDFYSNTATTYDVVSSVKNNAFALRYNEDGSISYRYLVNDCDSGYTIIEESTLSGLVKEDEWSTIAVRFEIMNGNVDDCGKPFGQRVMKLYIYVNGYLKFVSKELPEFNFTELDDTYLKQEGVPFNISLGGGTQGLCDSIWIDYNNPFPYVLPIEENFAGTFIGDIKTFKFYTCGLEFNEIRNNYLSDTIRK